MGARYQSLATTDAIDATEADDTRRGDTLSASAEIEEIAPDVVADADPAEEELSESRGSNAGTGTSYSFGGTVLNSTLLHVDLDNLHTLEPIPGIRIDGTEGNDVINGGAGDDELYGWGGDDVIDGGDGNDFIWGSIGYDVLTGGAGDDKLGGGMGSDKLIGGDGNDYLDVGVGQSDYGGGVAFGDAGDDTIYADRGVDHLYGGDGNDTIKSGQGVDYLDGGAGDDKLDGSTEDDMLWGGAGNDELLGSQHNDLLYGGVGDDVLYGDYIHPGAEIGDADSVYGEDGNDRVYGGGGNDTVDGGAGNDYVDGGYGNDLVHGGAGDDEVYGGFGNDVIYGDRGSDLMAGGGGRDTFVFTERPFQGYYYSERDVITDFNGNPFSGDKIDLRQLFDKYTNFTGTTADQARGQGYLYFVEQAGPGGAGFGTTVYIDPNGNAADPSSPYVPHDMAVVHLEGVSRSQISSIGSEFYGYQYNFLV